MRKRMDPAVIYNYVDIVEGKAVSDPREGRGQSETDY
jgi:hypothetical protein